MSLLIAIFLFLIVFLIVLKVGGYQKEKRRRESSGDSDSETKIEPNRVLLFLVCTVIIIFLASLIYVGLEGKKDYQTIKFISSSGDSKIEVYNNAIDITQVKSDANISVIFTEIVKKGMTTFFFNYSGKGELSFVAIPLVYDASVKLPINPPNFLSVKLEKGWQPFSQTVFCKQNTQIVIRITVPKGGEAHIKDVEINTK